MNKEKKVGLFILISMIFLIGLFSYLESFNQILSKKYNLHLFLKNSAGLSINSKVKLLGLDIGYIDKIELKEKKILLTLKIDKNIKIPKDSVVLIKKKNLLGGKFLNISPGDSKETLANNKYLTKIKTLSSLANTTDSANVLFEQMNLLINDFRDIMTQTEKDKIKNIISNSDKLISNIESFFRLNENKMENIVTNFNKSLIDISKMSNTITDSTNSITKEINKFNKKLTKSLDNFNNSLKKIDSISSVVSNKLPTFFDKTDTIQDSIQNILGKNEDKISNLVVSVDSFFKKGEEAITTVNEYIDTLNKAEIEIEASSSKYINKNISFSKSDARLYYSPNSDKSYILGLSSGPDFSENNLSKDGYIGAEKHKKSKYLISLEYAYKGIDNLVLRGGLINSTGGIGIDYLFNKNSNIKLTTNLYDLNAVNDVRGDYPNLTSTLRYKIFNIVNLYFGTNNILNKDIRNVSFGLGVNFIDKDLKSIFGAVLTSTK